MNNAGRVAKIERLLGLCGNDTDGEYYRVADVITDLRHFCKAKGIDFEQEQEMAETYYLDECEEETA